MKRDITQDRQVRNSGQENKVKVGKRSIQGWDTELERSIAACSYPALSDAFKTAAEVLDGNPLGWTVADAVKTTKPRAGMTSAPRADWYGDYSDDMLGSILSGKKVSTGALPRLSSCIAISVFMKLWWLSKLLNHGARRQPLRRLVAEITAVCVLAERARNVLHTELRVKQWHTLAHSGILRATTPRRKSTAKEVSELIDKSMHDLDSWLKQNPYEFTTASDAARDFTESVVHPFDPMLILSLFRRAERSPQLEAKSCDQSPMRHRIGSNKGKSNGL